jgi:hypothetical protein
MRSLSCLLLAAGLLLAARSHAKPLRGLDPALADKYDAASGRFTCLDGFKTIEYKHVNDNFCDCQDGSDEPGAARGARGPIATVFFQGGEVTRNPAARRHGRLHDRAILLPQPRPRGQVDLLHLRGGRRLRWVASLAAPPPRRGPTPARRAADRTPAPTDCCDGSDERSGCTNKCLEEAATIKQALQAKLANYEAALAKRADYIERAKVKRAEMVDRRANIDKEIEDQKSLIVELKGARRDSGRGRLPGGARIPAGAWRPSAAGGALWVASRLSLSLHRPACCPALPGPARRRAPLRQQGGAWRHSRRPRTPRPPPLFRRYRGEGQA